MNAGAELGAIPAKVLESVRASVTAGLAKLVELVNQYAAAMYAATANGAAEARPERTTPNTTRTSPNVATTSPRKCAPVARWCVDHVTAASPNMRLATIAPSAPPRTC